MMAAEFVEQPLVVRVRQPPRPQMMRHRRLERRDATLKRGFSRIIIHRPSRRLSSVFPLSLDVLWSVGFSTRRSLPAPARSGAQQAVRLLEPTFRTSRLHFLRISLQLLEEQRQGALWVLGGSVAGYIPSHDPPLSLALFFATSHAQAMSKVLSALFPQ
jgi:hypothetical protein